MLTKYYYLLRKSLNEGTMFEGTSFNGKQDDRFTLGDYNGYQKYLYEIVKGSLGTSYIDQDADKGNVIVVGSGNAPETKEDYTIEDLTPQFSHIGNSYSCSIKENRLEHTWVRVLRNDTESDIVVREIGFIEKSYATFTSASYPFLVFRKVLENEVTVSPGNTITINLVIGEGVEDVSVS